MPANQTFSVTLSLKDADTVKRGLEQLGTSGQNALKRLESATTPASKGLMALDAAAGAVKGGLSELAGMVPGVSAGMAELGKGGLGAAAGIAAVGAAAAALVARAHEVTKHLADIADGASRIGASGEEFQALRLAFIENASSADEMARAVETLRAKVGDAMAGAPAAVSAFARLGITQEQLAATLGNGARQLELVAIGLQSITDPSERAAAAQDVLGKAGKGLDEAMGELAGTLQTRVVTGLQDGSIASNELSERAGKLQDELDLLNEKSKVLGAEGLLTIEIGFVHIMNEVVAATAALVNYYAALLKVAKAGGGIGMLNSALAPKADADASESEKFALKAQQDRNAAKRANDRGLVIELNTPRGGRGGGRRTGGGQSAAVRDAERDAKAIADLQKEIDLFGKSRDTAIDKATSRLSDHASAEQIAEVKELAGQLYDLGEAQNAATEAEREHQKLLSEGKAIYEATRTPAEEYADTLARLNELQSADVITPTTYNRALDDAKEKLDAITQKTSEANAESSKWFDQLQLNTTLLSTTSSTLSAMFTEAFMGERKLADVLEEIPGLITKIIMQKLIELAITTAIQAASGGAGGAGAGIGGAIASLFSGGSGAGAGGGYQMGSMSTTPIVTSARGNVFGSGNIIPFARGGIVDRPTLFPMAKGAGLMGEAGPEAVLPLKRTASGDLGVRAQTAPMQVVINNYSDANVQQREERGSDGSMRLILDMVKKEVASDMVRPGTQLNKAVGAANNPVRVR